MRNRMLFLISACLYYSGSMRVIQWLHRHCGRRLLILNYHQASGGELRSHLLYLRKHFRLEFLDHALETLFTTRAEQTAGKDRRLRLAITFDDGYLDNYTHAYALARELEIPITIFLISSYIGEGAAFWWFDHLVEKAQVAEVTIDGNLYHLNKADEAQALAQSICTQVSARADEASRRAYLCEVIGQLSAQVAIESILNEKPVSMFSWEQAEEMQASGMVAFGGHTLHHPTLAALANADEAFKEVAVCRSLVQEKLGRSASIFAYPHGGIQHIGVNGMSAVQRAGYRWAVTTLQGANTAGTHPYFIRRISANTHIHWLLIALMTSGLWDFLSYFNWFVTRMKRRKTLKEMRLPAVW